MSALPSQLTTYFDGPYADGILNIFSTEHPNEKATLNLFIVYVPNHHHSDTMHLASNAGVIKTVIKVYNMNDLEPSDVVDFAFAYVNFMIGDEDDAQATVH